MMLGKKPATVDPRDLKFSAYLTGEPLPGHPRTFGHEALVPAWKMLGNDSVGDCVIAGGAHETMLWNAECGVEVPFDDASVLSDYSAIAGYDPNDPSTDQGTDMRAALKYRRSTGLLDANGKRHKIGGFVALKPGNIDELLEAIWLFGAVAIGFEMPSSAMDQFDAGKPWSVVTGSPIEGGHYTPGCAVRGAGLLSFLGVSRDLVVVTWAKLQPVTLGFVAKYCDEAFAILSEEMIGNTGKSLEGYDLAQLRADLAGIPALA
ncbi:MAG TPA: hypothetical protein VGQ38_15415 [Gaiellaceae bacterium]|jgi:hypothetical protein|nr:hypothetical protein [Gaiellaceae bacterium]